MRDAPRFDWFIEWTGDLKDDCTAKWEGLVLRAEKLDKKLWWWAVYHGRDAIADDSEPGAGVVARKGRQARQLAELVARTYVLGRQRGALWASRTSGSPEEGGQG